MTIGTDDQAIRTIMLLLKADRRATMVENKKGQIPLEMISYSKSPRIWEALAVITMITIGESKTLDEKSNKRFMRIINDITKRHRNEILGWDMTKALKTLGMLDNDE